MSPFLPDHRSARQPEGRCRNVSGAVCWRAAQEGRCWEDNYGGRHPPISTSLWLPGSLLPRLSAHLTKLPDAGRLFPTLCYSPPGRRHCPAPPSLTGVLALQHVVGTEELSQVFLLVVSVPVFNHLFKLFHQHVALWSTAPGTGKAPTPNSLPDPWLHHDPRRDRQAGMTRLRKLRQKEKGARNSGTCL